MVTDGRSGESSGSAAFFQSYELSSVPESWDVKLWFSVLPASGEVGARVVGAGRHGWLFPTPQERNKAPEREFRGLFAFRATPAAMPGKDENPGIRLGESGP